MIPSCARGLQDPSRGNAYVIVILESCTYQALEFTILKYLPPFLVAQRLRGDSDVGCLAFAGSDCTFAPAEGDSAVPPRYIPGTSTAGRL